MADSAGTDTHRMCTCTCLTFSVAPSIPILCSPSYPSDVSLFPAYAHARGNGKWGLVVSLTFEHSSLSRSRPQRNPPLSPCLAHPFSHPSAPPVVTSHSLSLSPPFLLLYESHENLHLSCPTSFASSWIFFPYCSSSSDEFNGWQLIRDRHEW